MRVEVEVGAGRARPREPPMPAACPKVSPLRCPVPRRALSKGQRPKPVGPTPVQPTPVGQHEIDYLERALFERADYLPAKWFIANVYTTLGRTDEAVVQLVELLERDDIPDEVREGARTLLEQIQSA